MKTFIQIPEPDAIETFSFTLTPINHAQPAPFSIRDKIGCIGLLVAVVSLMRLLVAN